MKKLARAFHRGRMLLLAPLLGVVFAFMLVVPAWAATVTNIDIPISYHQTLVSRCNGVTINLSGVEHFTFRVTPNPNGSFNIGEHINSHLTGTDDQGNSYVSNQEFNSTLNDVQPGVVRTLNQTFRLISTGSAVNNLMHFIIHVTVNANDTVTALVDTFTDTCVGG